MFYVYVLQSERNQRFYTGSTDNIDRRTAEHNAGKSPYDRLNKPFKLVYYESVPTRSEAVKLERYYKTGAGREKLKKLINMGLGSKIYNLGL